MTRQLVRSLICLLTIAVLGGGDSARAGSITVSSVTATATFGGSVYGPVFDETVALPQFASSVGLLQSIALTVDVVGTTPGWSLNVYNPFAFNVGATGVISGSLRVLRPDASLIVLVGHSSPFVDLGTLPSHSTTTVAIAVADTTETIVLTDPADLALFTGLDSLTLRLRGSGYPNVFPDTLDIPDATPQEGFGRVTATYTFVPEPSSLVLMLTVAIPGVALAFRTHQRHRSSARSGDKVSCDQQGVA